MKSNWKHFGSLDQLIAMEANEKTIKTVGNSLKYVLENKMCDDDGLWLEFGVCDGESINTISSFTSKEIYGFDSFFGLPEPWTWSSNNPDEASYGSFNREGKLPKVPNNVKLIVGWFNKTLPEFVSQHKNMKVSLIHVDCDLYSSTKTVLTELKPYICSGTVICFDDLLGYPNYKEHEIKAFYEFLRETNYEFEWLCGEMNEVSSSRETAVAVRIL